MRPLTWLVAISYATALRAACLHSDLWLDEVLSWNLSRNVTSPFSVFALRTDNNHPINTVWLSFWEAGVPPWCLRLHSFIAGVAAVFLLGVVGRRLNAGTPALVLVASSWWLVLASADARGYALAVTAALAAFLCLDRYLVQSRLPFLAGFWVAVVIAFLSHMTCLHAYLGMIAWSVRGGDSRQQARRLMTLHLVPATFFAAYYFGFLKGLTLEGGPPPEYGRVLTSLLSRGFGGSSEGILAVPFLVSGVSFFALGLRSLIKAGDTAWVFFLVACVLAPGLFTLLQPMVSARPILFERYYLVSFAFALPVVARGLIVLPRVPLVVVLLIVAVGGTCLVLNFARHGRGTLAPIARHLLAEGGTVTGDDDFQVPTMLRHLAPDVPFVKEEADWLIVHCHDARFTPGEEERDRAGNAYALVASSPAADPAAWGWFLYRNKNRPLRSPPN